MPRSDKLSHNVDSEEFFVILKEIESFRSEGGETLFGSNNIKEVLVKYNEYKDKYKDNEELVVEIIDRFNNPIWERELKSMIQE